MHRKMRKATQIYNIFFTHSITVAIRDSFDSSLRAHNTDTAMSRYRNQRGTGSLLLYYLCISQDEVNIGIPVDLLFVGDKGSGHGDLCPRLRVIVRIG